MLRYALLYQPFLCSLRLFHLGLIKKSDFLKIYNPYWESKYFGALFLNRIPKDKNHEVDSKN